MTEQIQSRNKVEFVGVEDKDCEQAVTAALDALEKKLGRTFKLLSGFTFIIGGTGEPKQGGEVDFIHKDVRFNARDNKMSIQQAEDYLVTRGLLETCDWTEVAPQIKDLPWSSLQMGIIHESGHIVDKLLPGPAYERMDVALGPTKYGREKGTHEAFAEAFTYWIFDAELSDEARKIVETTIKKWGDL